MQRWVFEDLKLIASDLRALAGEAEPTGARGGQLPLGVPEVWVLPTGQVAIRDGADTYWVVEPEAEDRTLYELPADAVRLAPAGGSAPTAEAAIRRVVDTIDFADSSYDYVCADVDTDVIRLAILNRKDVEVTTAVLRDEIRAFVASLAGGSAPHQGATTDVTALLAHLDWLDERAMKGGHLLLRTDDVRALLAGKSIPIGPSADRALLGAGETTEETT